MAGAVILTVWAQLFCLLALIVAKGYGLININEWTFGLLTHGVILQTHRLMRVIIVNLFPSNGAGPVFPESLTLKRKRSNTGKDAKPKSRMRPKSESPPSEVEKAVQMWYWTSRNIGGAVDRPVKLSWFFHALNAQFADFHMSP